MSLMRTQWRVGMGGATGLDYNVLLRLMDRRDFAPDRYEEVLLDVQQIECFALDIINTKPDKT